MNTQSESIHPFTQVPQATHTVVHNQPHKKKKSIKDFFDSKTFFGVVVLVEFVIIVILLNPVRLYNDFQNNQAVKSVSELVQVSEEQPIVAIITNADELRAENTIQAEVYKDAKDGDYVLGYNDRMIIYRKSDNVIIYDGATPQMKLQSAQQQIITEITDVAKSHGIIPQSSSETPQVSVITDVTVLKAQDEDFYANARNNDVLVIFPQNEVIMIYNAETREIVNSGKYTTIIK